MKKIKKNDLEFTSEQIKEICRAFKSHDITTGVSLYRNDNHCGRNADAERRIKELFSQYWLNVLQDFGINRMMKNYSNDYPIKVLENADAAYFSERIIGLLSDPGQLEEAVDGFFIIYEKPVSLGFTCYCKNAKRELDELTEDEIEYVLETVADVINEEFIKTVMVGQQVPEIYGVSNQNPTHEDFSKVFDGNYDLINFHNKWTYCKTKLGAPLFLDDLSPEESNGMEGARAFFASADDRTQKEYEEIRDIFSGKLSDIDREIYYLREQGYTHSEIASRLGYKTPSAVTKRLKNMLGKFKEFCGYVEEGQKKERPNTNLS